MSEEKKPSFGESLGNLFDAIGEMAKTAPEFVKDVSPLLPESLRPKTKSVLPEEISITFVKLDKTKEGDPEEWVPLLQGDSPKHGDRVGRYRLVSEAPWGEPPPKPEEA